MWVWILLEGVNLFGGTEKMWARSDRIKANGDNMNSDPYVYYFNQKSEYYCPNVRIIDRQSAFSQ